MSLKSSLSVRFLCRAVGARLLQSMVGQAFEDHLCLDSRGEGAASCQRLASSFAAGFLWTLLAVYSLPQKPQQVEAWMPLGGKSWLLLWIR